MGKLPRKNTLLRADNSLPSSDEPLILPHGWKEYRDPLSGNFYYANKKTGQSSWDRPKPDPNQPSSIEPQVGKSTSNVGQSKARTSREVQKRVSFSSEFKVDAGNDASKPAISFMPQSRKLFRTKSKKTSRKASLSRPMKLTQQNATREHMAILRKLKAESAEPEEDSSSRQFKFALRKQHRYTFPVSENVRNSSDVPSDKSDQAAPFLLPANRSTFERKNNNLISTDLSSEKSDSVRITTSSGLQIATRSKSDEYTETVTPGSNVLVPKTSFLGLQTPKTLTSLVRLRSAIIGSPLSTQKSIKKVFASTINPAKTDGSKLQVFEPDNSLPARSNESTKELDSPMDTPSNSPSGSPVSPQDGNESRNCDRTKAPIPSSLPGVEFNMQEDDSQVEESIMQMNSMTHAMNNCPASNASSPPFAELVCLSFVEQDKGAKRDGKNKFDLIHERTQRFGDREALVGVETAYKDQSSATENAFDEDNTTQLSGSSGSLNHVDMGISGWVVDDVGEKRISIHESRCGDCGLSRSVHDHLLFVGGLIFSLVGKPSQEMRKNMEDVGDLFADEVSEDGSEC